MYEICVTGAKLKYGNNQTLDIKSSLSNGRSSYVIFESLVRELTGLKKVKNSDHVDSAGRFYEQKS